MTSKLYLPRWYRVRFLWSSAGSFVAMVLSLHSPVQAQTGGGLISAESAWFSTPVGGFERLSAISAQNSSGGESQSAQNTGAQPPPNNNPFAGVDGAIVPSIVPDHLRHNAPVPANSAVNAAFGSAGVGASQNVHTGGTPAVFQLESYWKTGYHQGFTIAPTNPDATPFELKVNGIFQFRYTGFARSHSTWTDSSGLVNDIYNRNDIQVARGLTMFSGYVYDPRLTYSIWIFGTTDVIPDVFALSNVGWKFSDAFTLRAGISIIPFGAEFLMSGFGTQMVDRSMATTFFEGDFAIGLTANGKLSEKFHYNAMMADGLSSYEHSVSQLDTNFLWAGALFYDAMGEYGNFISDIEDHECPALRFVTSGIYSPQRPQPNGKPFAEASNVRLSDGTPVVQTGALAPGVTVNSFDQYGLAQSAQLKYQGFSLYGEGLAISINNAKGTGGPIPEDNQNLLNWGLIVQGGYFLVPKKIELAARTSHVYGKFGHGEEYSVGANHFFKGNPLHKFSVDLQHLVNNPTSHTFSGYVAGQSGNQLRIQYQLAF